MAERLANLGYLGFKKESVKGTAVTPNIYAPIYEDGFMTNLNLVEDNPIIGNKFKRYQVLQGQRGHKGTLTTMAEPNTAGYLLDMILNKVSTSGAGPYTHSFALNSTNPNSYTFDISTGNRVFRFFGVEISKIAPKFDANEMKFDVSFSALGSVYAREVASVATNTVTLTTTYDPIPTTGFVVSDLVRLQKASDGSTQDFTVSSITNTTLVLSGSPSGIAAGDMIFLRPATAPTYTILTPFLWSSTQFCFGATAAAALSATQTRLEDGSAWELTHDFEDDEGSKRSGLLDPAALIRTQGDINLKIKKFFDDSLDEKDWLAIAKKACVIRHYNAGTTYELRVTINHLKSSANPKPKQKSGEIDYAEIDYMPQYDTTDGQAFDIKVINNVSTI